MSRIGRSAAVLCVSLMWLHGIAALAQDEVADVPSQDRQVAGSPHQRYFLIGPHKDTQTPPDGFGLVLILPGGNGSAGYHPFVKRIYKYSIPPGYLAVQLVAVNWTPQQQIVWPTARSRVQGQEFTTEQFVTAVVADIQHQQKLDPRRILILAWSSSGPAAYATSLAPDTPITGSFIAMSVFRPQDLPGLTAAKGRAYLLYHSPGDRTCPLRMARSALDQLQKHGATAKLTTYTGGHGWTSRTLFQDIRDGIAWLDRAAAAPTGSAASRPTTDKAQ
jgi:predicted esterase